MYVYKMDNLPIKVWAEKGEIEEGALQQIETAARLPFAFHHVALMADGHQGYGIPIGGVVATRGVVIPNCVGVDIACGVIAVKLSLTEIDDLEGVVANIKDVIPVGFNKHEEPQDGWLMPAYYPGNHEVAHRERENALMSLGTLGGGNHFIEIQRGDDGHIWVMVHSGSRNLGYKIAKHYNDLAVTFNERWHSSVPKKWGLAFLPLDTVEGQDYLREMNYAVEYAFANRKLMLDRILDVLPDCENASFINIAHNFASMENHFGQNVMVHRKGATLARKGQLGIIPGSQGTKSYIVEGLGNKDSFQSCSHGAGRVMGRKQAKQELDLAEEIKKLDDQGIIHGIKEVDDLDEATGAYKSIETVMANQKDLVEIKVELTPLAVVKG